MNTPTPLVLRFSGSADHPRISRRPIEASVLWNRPPPAPKLDLSGTYDFSPFRDPFSETQSKVLDHFLDAHLFWGDCMLLDDWFHNTFFNTGERQARNLATRAPGSEEQLVTGLRLLDGQLVIDQDKLANPIMIDEPLLAATPNEPRHWGHFLAESVPALAAFAREPRRYGKLFIHLAFPGMREMLALLGIPMTEVVQQDLYARYRLRTVQKYRYSHWFFYFPKAERRVFRDLADRVQRTMAPGPRRVYVSRLSHTRAGGYRALINEEQLIEALARLDFTVVEPERMSAADQIATFAGADAIVGLGGAAMFNAVFCRPGTKLLDIESTPFFLEAHANLFASCGLQYGMIVGSVDPADRSVHNRRWHLDVHRAMPTIRDFFGT